jgi:hypothetical protein
MMKRIRWFLLGTVLMAHAALADPVVTFSLDPPTGVLAGAQGASVGWGYTIINADVGFLVIKSISFEDLDPGGQFLDDGVPEQHHLQRASVHGALDRGP